MTINTTTAKQSFDGNGVTTAFPLSFVFYGAAELEVVERVVATGVETVKQLTTHYTVTGGNGTTGTVTAVAAPPASVSWTIARKTARSQLVAYPANDPFPSSAHERALDRLTAIAQELEELLGRALTFPLTDAAAAIGGVPSVADRANRLLGFDSAGKPMATAGVALGGFIVSSFTQTLLDDPDQATARATLGAGTGNGTADYPTQGTAIASAATITLPGNLAQQTFDITGNTGPITAISSRAAGSSLRLVFTGTPQINHNATTLILQGAANITLAAGDVLELVATAAGWRMTGIARATGQALVPGQQRVVGTVIAQNPYTINATVTGAHGLAGVPHEVRLELECLTADLNYAPGERVQLSDSVTFLSGTTAAISVSWDATNVTLITGNSGAVAIPNKTTRANTSVTAASWRLNAIPIRWQ
jgi:hypothetical protein